MPVIVESAWCAYMFDMHGSEVHVLDPAYASERISVHMEIHKIVHTLLTNCLASFFDGWTLKSIDCWKLQYPTLPLFDHNQYELHYILL